MNLGLEGFGGDELKQRNSGSHWLQDGLSPQDWQLRVLGSASN